MAPRSTQTAGLNLEDFRRLGVRPHEYRLTVIRQAAIRSARVLAERQLVEPTQKAGLQLSRVATSAYRLLDPRQRQESTHRAFVGRILPQALSWAGQTNFHNEVSDFGSTTGGIARLPFERSSLSDAELIEMLDLDAPPKPRQLSSQGWVSSLSDVDLLEARPITRRIAAWSAGSRFPWLLVSIAGLFIGAMIGFVVHQWVNSGDTFAGIRTVEKGANRSAPNSMSSNSSSLSSADVTDSSANPAPRPLVERSQMVEPSPKPVRSLVPDEVREILAPESSQDSISDRTREESSVNPQTFADAGATTTVESTNRGIQGETEINPVPAGTIDAKSLDLSLQGPTLAGPVVSGRHGANESLSPVELASSDGAKSASTIALPHALEPLPDPFGPDVVVAVGAEEVLDIDSPPSMATTSSLPRNTLKLDEGTDYASDGSAGSRDGRGWEPSQRVSVPSDVNLRSARRELFELMPQLDVAFEADAVALRIEQLESIERKYEPGSAEQWVIRTLIGEASWLVETVAQVEQRLASLVAMYNVTPHELLAETFVGASQHATLPSTRAHLLDNGLRLADQLLMVSSPSECKEVVEAMGSFAPSVMGPDVTVSQYLKSFADAVDQMNRHTDVLERVNEQSVQLASADVKVLGRHYCFMLRRWDEGLEWLTKTSDGRIARVADLELRLGEDPTAAELKEVADQWLARASRLSGRTAESIRLHAIDLLKKAQHKADGLTRLEIDRQIDDASALVPPHLLPLPNVDVGSAQGFRVRRNVPTSGVPLL